MPDDGPILTPIRQALGEERLVRFMKGHAAVQATAMFLVASTTIMPHADYSDEALAAMQRDASDLRAAADRWATDCEELCEAWRAQRGPLSESAM